MKETTRFRLFRTLGKLEKPVKYGPVAVQGVAVSDDGAWLLSRGPSHQNSAGYLWDLRADAEPLPLGALNPCTISTDGVRVLGFDMAREGASAIAWNVPSLDVSWRHRAWADNSTRSDPAVARTTDLVAYGYDRTPVVHVRRASDGVLCWPDDRAPRGRDLTARGLAFSRAGDRLYAVTQHYADRFVHVLTAFDSKRGTVIWEHDTEAEIARVLVTPDDATVIALFRSIEVRRSTDGTLIAQRPNPIEDKVIQACAMSPQGELFIAGDGFAQLVEPGSGEVLDSWKLTAKRFPTCAAFSADGQRLFLGTNGAVVLCYERR